MIRIAFKLLVPGIRHVWLYLERGAIKCQMLWYESEIEYLDKRIAELERDG